MRFNANTTCQDGLKLTEAYNNPFVLVNEDNITERMGVFNAENRRGQIKYAVSCMCLKNCIVRVLISCF